MSAGAIIFMLVSWTFVLGLMGWSFARIMRAQRTPDSNSNDPADHRAG